MSKQLDLERIARLPGPVMFIGFHPDDLEFHASGLAACLASKGADLLYVVATSGEANGSSTKREYEQMRAASAVGVDKVVFLRLRDGALFQAYNSGQLQERIANAIRAYNPAVIVTFCPANLTSKTFGSEHPDHRYGAMAVWDAIYPQATQSSRRTWRHLWRAPLPGHKVKEVLWFGDDLQPPFEANCMVLIDNVWEKVTEALSAHASQWNESSIIAKASARAGRAATRWRHYGRIEEYHHIILSDKGNKTKMN